MYFSKFIVSIISLLQFSINSIAGQWNNANTDNPIDGKVYDNDDFNNGTDMFFVELKPLKSSSLSGYKTLDRSQGKRKFKFLIAGGYRPENDLFSKYLVSIRSTKEKISFGDNHLCGGSIISKKVILTAAHCVISLTGKASKPESIIIVAGTPRRLLRTGNTQVVAVDKVITHPDYSIIRNIAKNDVAILKLKRELQLNEEFVGVLPMTDSPPKTGTKCTILGWGEVIHNGPKPDEVLNADITILDQTKCEYLKTSNGGICARNHVLEIDSGSGDSGGPMICNNKQVGIISRVAKSRRRESGVYTDVYYYRKWIAQNGANYIGRLIDKLMLLLLAIIELAINT